MLAVSGIFIYPIKSLRGISLGSSEVVKRGFKYDRQWMLVDENANFLSQREHARMALLAPAIVGDQLVVTNLAFEQPPLSIPLEYKSGDTMMATVWGDRCRARMVSEEADAWFTTALDMKCRLVYMPETTNRWVDGRYASNKETTTFTDGYPFMMLGEASLNDLNERLATPVPMNRFRPNLVFTGGAPYEEDLFAAFRIGGLKFFGVKRCGRCVVTTIDQDNATTGKEPLKTLASYRTKNKKVYFGQNLLHRGSGAVRIGDVIEVFERHNF